MIITIVFISIWITLGICNIFIYKEAINAEAEENSWMFNPSFTKRFVIVMLMLLSPYCFVVGIRSLVREYLLLKKVNKLLNDICEKEGIDLDKIKREIEEKK